MKTNVLISGLPGKMATAFLECLGKDFNILPYALTGQDTMELQFGNILLFKPYEHKSMLAEVKNNISDFVIVDFSHPTAVNQNVDLYCELGIPFVMGTTGGDREKIKERIMQSNAYAVVAPNMAKQIVGFQAMMEYASNAFPDLFKGYKLNIVESHQKEKADTSGTAKVMVSCYNKLGITFSNDQIQKIREETVQLSMGIPKEYLAGHGWHTYTLQSKDNTVQFQFTHNVNGRDIYALGTIDAVLFLQEKVKKGQHGIYSMIDVIKN